MKMIERWKTNRMKMLTQTHQLADWVKIDLNKVLNKQMIRTLGGGLRFLSLPLRPEFDLLAELNED